MHWTEIAAIVIIAAALVPVVVLLFCIAAIAWAGVTYRLTSRRIDLGREYRCEHGIFVRKDHSWVAEITYRGRQLSLDARDDHGAPNAAFLRRLPAILARLPDFEHSARAKLSEILNEHSLNPADYTLDSILSPVRDEDNYEFALGFNPIDEESYEMSIYVNFKDDNVIGWLGVD